MYAECKIKYINTIIDFDRALVLSSSELVNNCWSTHRQIIALVISLPIPHNIMKTIV